MRIDDLIQKCYVVNSLYFHMTYMKHIDSMLYAPVFCFRYSYQINTVENIKLKKI